MSAMGPTRKGSRASTVVRLTSPESSVSLARAAPLASASALRVCRPTRARDAPNSVSITSPGPRTRHDCPAAASRAAMRRYTVDAERPSSRAAPPTLPPRSTASR
jgi:hypothetical protein